MSRPPAVVTAEMAELTPEQRAFRVAAKGRLDLALPRDVWLDHRFSVLPNEVRRPRAMRRVRSGNGEPWFDFMQVVQRAVNPRSRRRVVMLSGGAMSNAARR